MDLDDFKDLESIETDNRSGIDNLMEVVDRYSKKQRHRAITYTVIFILMAVFYSSLVKEDTILYNTGLHLITAGLILGALYYTIRHTFVTPSLYGLSITDFLSKAQKRLSFMRTADYIIIIPILLILGTGGGMILVSRISQYTDDLTITIVVWIVFYTGLCIFGFVAGRKNWLRDHGDLLLQVEQYKKALEEIVD